MSLFPKLAANNIKNYLLRIDKFNKGTNTLLNPKRTPKEAAVEILNMNQVQDGIWKTRPGTAYYGVAIPEVDSIDGVAEYVKSDGTRELVAVAGGTVYVSTNNAASWTDLQAEEETPLEYTEGIKPYFIQVIDRLYIANGEDPLSYYDGTGLNIFEAISDPSAPTVSRGAGLSDGDYLNAYSIVALNEVGTTLPSDVDTIMTDIPRDAWSEVDEYLEIEWSAVEGATLYEIYRNNSIGDQVFLASTTDLVYQDNGSAAINEFVGEPEANTTGAPMFRSMEVSGDRLWGTYDPDNPWRVFYSSPLKQGAVFAPSYGGGYVDLELGGRNRPVSVVHYRDGKGAPHVTVLCTSPDGQGAIFQMEFTTLTVGSSVLEVLAPLKIVGSIGADSPTGVVKAGDEVLFINKKGVFSLRNKQQIFNVLVTDDLSAPIRNKFESLNPTKIPEFTGYYKPPRVYFSVAESNQNNRIAIYDFERRNWTWSWHVGFKHLFEYTDTGGTSRFLGVPYDTPRLVEISENITGDLGVAFPQSYLSPIVPVSDDYTDMAKIRDTIVELGKLNGMCNFRVLGLTKDNQVVAMATKTIESASAQSTTGWGDDQFSDMLFSDTEGVPESFAEDVTKSKMKINKKLYGIQFQVSANTKESNYEILGFQAKGFVLPKRAPARWS